MTQSMSFLICYSSGTLEIDAIPETFSLTTEEPSPQYGLSGCRTQIRFTHEPAKSNKTYTPPEKTIVRKLLDNNFFMAYIIKH